MKALFFGPSSHSLPPSSFPPAVKKCFKRESAEEASERERSACARKKRLSAEEAPPHPIHTPALHLERQDLRCHPRDQCCSRARPRRRTQHVAAAREHIQRRHQPRGARARHVADRQRRRHSVRRAPRNLRQPEAPAEQQQRQQCGLAECAAAAASGAVGGQLARRNRDHEQCCVHAREHAPRTSVLGRPAGPRRVGSLRAAHRAQVARLQAAKHQQVHGGDRDKRPEERIKHKACGGVPQQRGEGSEGGKF
eukprot:364374-Chlamydomonas_euryale.AAC.16